jgi:Heparinase II/III-like protein/Heparinase II/III N-terminus
VSEVTVATVVTPRDVRCVIEHLHRDLAVADDACRGRFTLAGVTCDLGPEPDWLGADLPQDEEWRIEWTKFYFGLDLAYAFSHTGDRRYVDAWERLVGSYLRQVPVGVDSSDVAARRVQNWVYAWTAFARAEAFAGLSEGLQTELLDRLGEQTRHIREHLTAERNHRTLELYALIVVALALPQLDPDGELLQTGIAEIHTNLLTDVRLDGVHREHSTHYHLIALRSFLGARDNLRRFGHELPASYDAHLSRACDFAMHCHRPDGVIPALSDSDNGGYADVLQLAADALERPDLRYVASAGAEGVAPAQGLAAFPFGGYWMQRSGWGAGDTAFADERFLIFDCGPVGDGGHGHYDVLSFEAMAQGRALVVDPGRHTYAELEPNLRHWFKGTAAHNTVVVDGLDQVPYRRGKPRKGTQSQAHFNGRLCAPGLDILDGQVRSVAYDAVHRRQIAFVADAYWLIVDTLTAATHHDYDLRFHLDAAAQDGVEVARVASGWVVGAPGLALLSLGNREPVVEAGWVSPDYGIKDAAPVVSLQQNDVTDTRFVTLVMPLRDGQAVPHMTFTGDMEGWTATIVDGEIADAVEWHPHPVPLGPAGALRAGRAAWTRRLDGQVVRAAVADESGGWRSWDGEVASVGRGVDL